MKKLWRDMLWIAVLVTYGYIAGCINGSKHTRRMVEKYETPATQTTKEQTP